VAINRTKVLDAAQKHRRKGNLERAIKEYRTLMEDDPTDQRMLLVLADLYVKTHKVDEALNAYKSIAYHYLKDDIYDKAVGVFKQALNLDPSDPTLRRDLGEAYHRMGRLKEAVGEYHQAQRLYEERKDTHNQRDILERMVRLEPDEPALRIKLAEHYVRLNMLEEAVGLFEYAARQFEEDGRLDDYLKVMERIIYMRPHNTEIRKKVAQHYLDAREPQKALKHLRNCFEISNTDVDTLRMMSFSFEQLGDTPKAVLVYSQLAKLYRDHGDAQRSHQVYEHILKLDPGHADARKMLAYDARQQQRAAQPQQPVAPQVHVIPEVEFLDDDLAAELGPPPGTAPPQKPVPRPQRPAPQKPVPMPQKPAPQKPASTSQNDLLSFAASTLDDLGDIGIDHIRSEPELPMLEIQPMELEPIKPEQTDEELDIRQAIDESRVFVKYGLKDRAVQTLGELVQRFPYSIESREEFALLYEKYGEKVLAADQYIELAKLVRATPARTTSYLEEATRLFGNRAQVEAIASAENLPFGSPPQDNFTSIDLLSEMDLDGALSSLGGAEPARVIEAVHDDEIFELDELDIELEDDFDASDLDMDTGPIDAQALALDDISELNLDTDEVMSDDFEDIDLISIDDLNLPQDTEHDHRIPAGFGTDVTVAQDKPKLPRTPQFGSGLSFTADEADAMFDNLFGDSSEMPSVNMSFSGSQDLGGLAEVDFLMEQGLVSEAEDALTRAESQNPESASIQRRRLNLQDMRSSGKFENPFSAANSLSKQFAYNSVDEMAAAQHQGPLSESSVPSLIGAGDNAVNTNFELGAAYMEMGLFDEAIEEFQQSLHDPDVAESASYNIALCEFKMGKAGQARQRLEQLLGKPSLTANVRSSASSLLARVG
jgi:pilus assembly protein FimV